MLGIHDVIGFGFLSSEMIRSWNIGRRTIEHKNYVALCISLILGNLTGSSLGISVSVYQVTSIYIV